MRIVTEGRRSTEKCRYFTFTYVRSSKRINNELKLPLEVTVQQTKSSRGLSDFTRTLSCFRVLLRVATIGEWRRESPFGGLRP